MRIVGPLVQTIGDLGTTVRGLARTREVATILIRHGFGALVPDIPGVPKADDHAIGTPDRFAAALAELGPTWVKLGQVLSTRPDLLPASWITALERLQDDVEPVESAALLQVLTDELGADWEARFDAFETEPLGTASIAQVHGATLDDGTAVVVKIQRPGIGPQVEADLAILRFFARQAVAEFPDLAAADPDGLLREFERSMRAELDFHKEAENLARFRTQFAAHAWIEFPRPHPELSTGRVLVMDRLVGTPIRHAREAGHDMAVVGKRYLDTVFEMLLGNGFFHGDMHPGNVFVLPGDRLGLIDCGMIGTLTEKMRAELVTMIFALQRGDHRTIARVLHDIAIKDGRLDFRTLEAATVAVVDEHFPPGAQLRDIEMGAFSMELVRRAAGLGARVPTSYMMVLKALVTAEGLANALFDEADPIDVAAPWFAKVAAERMTTERLQMEGLYTLLTLTSLLERLPLSAAQLLDDLDAQRLKLGIQIEGDPLDRAQADRRTGRIIAGGLAGSLVLAGAIVQVGATTVVWTGLLLWVLAIPLAIAAVLGWIPRGRSVD
jgi:ubiquinone biosynthesis protein